MGWIKGGSMDITCNTDRLHLTNLQPIHADKVLEFYLHNKEHFEPYEPDRDSNFYNIHFQRLSLSMEHSLMMQNKAFRLWFFKKNDYRNIVGSVNFYNITYGPYCTCQIGYKLDHGHTNKGYALEGVRKGMELFLERYPNIHRIEASIMPSNLSSIKLIEKLGFEYEGLSKKCIRINFNWEDHYRFAYLTKEYDN